MLRLPFDRERIVLCPGKETLGMTNICTLTREFLSDCSGQDLIEYALIGAFIAMALVASMKTLTNNIGRDFNAVGSNF